MSYRFLTVALTFLFTLAPHLEPLQVNREGAHDTSLNSEKRLFRTGIGRDLHHFSEQPGGCLLAGLLFEELPTMRGNSDSDVVFHALCNAIVSLTHAPISCHEKGREDSRLCLKKILETLGSQTIVNISLTIEGARPVQQRCEEIRQSVADMTSLSIDRVGVTFTPGDPLTPFGKGQALSCFASITTLSF